MLRILNRRPPPRSRRGPDGHAGGDRPQLHPSRSAAGAAHRVFAAAELSWGPRWANLPRTDQPRIQRSACMSRKAVTRGRRLLQPRSRHNTLPVVVAILACSGCVSAPRDYKTAASMSELEQPSARPEPSFGPSVDEYTSAVLAEPPSAPVVLSGPRLLVPREQARPSGESLLWSALHCLRICTPSGRLTRCEDWLP